MRYKQGRKIGHKIALNKVVWLLSAKGAFCFFAFFVLLLFPNYQLQSYHFFSFTQSFYACFLFPDGHSIPTDLFLLAVSLGSDNDTLACIQNRKFDVFPPQTIVL